MNKYLIIFLICGLTFLIDIDHAVSLIIKGIPLTLENLNSEANRFLHLPALYAFSFYAIFESVRYNIKKK